MLLFPCHKTGENTAPSKGIQMHKYETDHYLGFDDLCSIYEPASPEVPRTETCDRNPSVRPENWNHRSFIAHRTYITRTKLLGDRTRRIKGKALKKLK